MLSTRKMSSEAIKAQEEARMLLRQKRQIEINLRKKASKKIQNWYRLQNARRTKIKLDDAPKIKVASGTQKYPHAIFLVPLSKKLLQQNSFIISSIATAFKIDANLARIPGSPCSG